MATLDNIVQVSIQVSNVTPSVPNFGTPMIPVFHTEHTDMIRYYSSLAAAEEDHEDGQIHDALEAAFSQNPRPQLVAVGRLTVASTMTVKLTHTLANSTVYSGEIDGEAFTFTSDSGATNAEVAAGLVSAINALTAAVTASATDSNTKVQIVADVPGTTFEVTDLSTSFASYIDLTAEPATSIATQMAAIRNVSDAWFAVCPIEWGGDVIAAYATFAATANKHCFAVTRDTDVPVTGSSDIASDLKTASQQNITLIHNRGAEDYKNVGAAAVALVMDPGTYTLDFKKIIGASAVTYTDTELGFLRTKRCNFYIEVSGLPMLQEGMVPSTTIGFTDLSIFLPFLMSKIQLNVFTLLAKNKKVPYTSVGIGLIGGAVKSALDIGVRLGALDKDSIVINLPRIEDADVTDKSNRILRGITFEAEYIAAGHSVIIQGTLV